MSGAAEIWARATKQVQLLQQQCGRAGPPSQQPAAVAQEAISVFNAVAERRPLGLPDLQHLVDMKV
jgi:hypothetical protein